VYTVKSRFYAEKDQFGETYVLTSDNSEENLNLEVGERVMIVPPIQETVIPAKEHHIWCNFSHKPVEDCEMCKGLNERYPMEGLTGDELQKKYFPNAVKREGT